MSLALGAVSALGEIGLQSILVRPKRAIGDFTAYVVLEEEHRDELEITEHPVEQGAAIADHAFKRPAEVTIHCGFSNSPANSSLLAGVASLLNTPQLVSSMLQSNSESQVRDIYSKLLQLQQSRVPVDIYTGKRIYKNMLLRSLTTSTSRQTENSLLLKVVARQVIIVQTQTVQVAAPMSNQRFPQSTTPTRDSGTKQLLPAPKFQAPQ
jgi:hypothetical protein